MSQWAAETLIATSLLLAIVLLLRGPVAQAFGPRAAYALWLAPLLRLVVPPFTLPVDAPQMWIETSSAAAASVTASTASVLPWATVLLSLWLGGAALFLFYHLIEYRRFLSRALADARPLAVPGIEDAAILATAAVGGPAATGLLIRRIFLPMEFERQFDAEERRLALLHEALHHRRGDLWAASLALAMLALHWFNPLAHAAYRAFRRDLEAACDADLLARAGPDARAAYARAIVRSAARPMPRAACALTHIDEVKGRLKMMKRNPGLIRRATGAALALALAAGGMTLSMPAVAETQAAAPEAEIKEEKVTRFRVVHKDGKVTSDIPADLRERMANCEGGEKIEALSHGGTGDRKRQTKILLCGNPGASEAELAAMIEKAITRIEGGDLPAENKAEILARLRAKIAELQAGQ